MKSKLLAVILCVVFANTLYSQRKIETEVFTLSSCDPHIVSLVNTDTLNNIRIKKNAFKLETRSKKLSALRITQVNPLRYKYYLNNEAVTQFMDASAISLSINSFTNGDYLNVAPEIKIPEIFKVDSISSKSKHKINYYQNRIRMYKDSLNLLEPKLEEIYYTAEAKELSLLDTTRTHTAQDTLLAKQKARDKQSRDPLTATVRRYGKLLDEALTDYQTFTANLPLNNPKFDILEGYSDAGRLTDSMTDNDLFLIKKMQYNFSHEYRNIHHPKFKKMMELMDRILPLWAPTSDIDSLKKELAYYGFVWAEPAYLYTPGYLNNRYSEPIMNVKQQILNKRFQLYEEFVINSAMMTGALVQNKFGEYSRFNNNIERLTCITDAMVTEIDGRRDRLKKTFEFVQKTSAELQILVSYLDINTELYESIAKKINSNYVFLLQYLKNLDFVYDYNQSPLFTLPSSTNLKNVDLIRYTVKREDAITNSSQTYNYDLWLRGGLKIDFSIGFFATQLSDNEYNKVLLDTIGGMDRISIGLKDKGAYSFAFGGMVNVTPRNGTSWFNVGGSIGVAYGGNQKLQVLTGLSFHLGKTERLIVHGGFAFGTISYLDVTAHNYQFFDQRDMKIYNRDEVREVDERYRLYMLREPDIKYSSFTIPTVDRFVARPFFGISYNLSKKNALQAISEPGSRTFDTKYKGGATN